MTKEQTLESIQLSSDSPPNVTPAEQIGGSEAHKKDATLPDPVAPLTVITMNGDEAVLKTVPSYNNVDDGSQRYEETQPIAGSDSEYMEGDSLLKAIRRQSQIVKDALADRLVYPINLTELSEAYEKNLFSPNIPPKRTRSGTCEPDPRINFYPPFVVPELLATYHVFFQNLKIPVTCRANRASADQTLKLKDGDSLPDCPLLDLFPKIFEGLGSEEPLAPNVLDKENESVLIELKNDSPRLAMMKRNISATYFAYPALNLPPKIMNVIAETLLYKKQNPVADVEESDPGLGEPVVSNEELASWLGVSSKQNNQAVLVLERRKMMLGAVLVTLNIRCMHDFFTNPEVMKKLEENIHYMFRHGYVKQACKVSNVELTNLVSYMGILHENRLGQSVLHNSLKGQTRRDYVRDCIFLYLVYTWQSAMGIWQQCLEEENLKQLRVILNTEKRSLWSAFDEYSAVKSLAMILFPEKLLQTLQNGLPDFASQSMMQNFRTFILERSGILPCFANALPTDFIPIKYSESPPPLWSYTYLLKLANYLMYHSDVAYDMTGAGVLDCYCRCNLCTPHRSLVFNHALLSESQTIGTFEIQGPQREDGSTAPGLKLTAGMWTSAYLRKFEPEDYHPEKIVFHENQLHGAKKELTACVITNSKIITQLQEIKKAREALLLKKGSGVYLDPQTGEELTGGTPSIHHNEASQEAASGSGLQTDTRRRGRKRRGGKGRRHHVSQQSRGGRITTIPVTSTTAAQETP